MNISSSQSPVSRSRPSRMGRGIVLVLLIMGATAGLFSVWYWNQIVPANRAANTKNVPASEKLDPQSQQQLKQLRQEYLRVKNSRQFTHLIQMIRDFLQEHPHHAPAHVLAGQVLVDNDNLTQALTHLDQALHLDPKQPQVLLMAGTLALMLQKPIQAQTYFQQAVQLNPAKAQYHVHLGEALLANKQPDSAQRAFEQALKLDSSAYLAWFGLADLKASHHDWTGALKDIRQARRQIPLGKEKVQATAFRKEANYLYQLKQFDAALLVLKKLSQTQQADPQVLAQQANCWAALHRPDQAAALYEKQLKTHPSSWRLAERAAYWQLQNHNLAQARAHLNHMQLLNAPQTQIETLRKTLNKASRPSSHPTPTTSPDTAR